MGKRDNGPPPKKRLGQAQPPDASFDSPDWKPAFFSPHENETIIALAQLIVPDAAGPGGKHAHVNRYIDLLFEQAVLVKPEREPFAFRRGLRFVDELSSRLYSKPFVSLSKGEQTSIVARLTRDRDWRSDEYQTLFHPVKRLIVECYFSSRVGLVNDLGYQQDKPLGDYEHCLDPEEHRN